MLAWRLTPQHANSWRGKLQNCKVSCPRLGTVERSMLMVFRQVLQHEILQLFAATHSLILLLTPALQ
ncbi:hypothetical protein D3C73_1538530 [compost metagenome]